MARPIYQRVAVTDAGDIIPGAEYTVTNENTGTEQTIYDARSGGSVISQPAFADSNGVIQFWTEPGVTYRVEATGGVGTYTDRYVEALTAQTSPTDTTAGALMSVGAFGVGADDSLPSVANLNTITASGIYRIDGGVTGVPAGLGSGTLFHQTRLSTSSVTRFTQIAIGDSDAKTFVRTNNNGTWSAWKRTDPQAFGLGLSPGIARFSGDLDTILTVGFYNIDVSACTNFPAGAGDGNLICQMWDSVVAGTQLFMELNTEKMYFRRRSGSTWQPWQELYHTGNLNTLEFGGGVIGDFVGFGYAVSAVQVAILLPTHLYNQATSLTVESNFTVRRVTSGSEITGVTNITLDPVSSGALTIALVSGLSGLTRGELIVLRQGTASSKITVNP